MAALLCYLFGWVGGLIFLLIEKNDRFVKFHAIQSIGLSVVLFALYIATVIVGFFPAIGGLLAFLLFLVLIVGGFALSIILMVRAYQGQTMRLPIIGDYAAKQAGL